MSTLAYNPSESPDVLIVGGGNAALCAAIAARRAGAEVVLAERASREWRGGNSKYTRNLRCVHDEGDSVMTGRYDEEEFIADLAKVTGEGTDQGLTRIAIRRSRDAPAWMEENGIRWQPALRGTLQLSRTNRFFLGGGKALVNAYFGQLERLGVPILYEHSVDSLTVDGERCTGVGLGTPRGRFELRPRSIVVASGGFEANLEWLGEYWGDAAKNFFVRGARQNDGLVLKCLLDAGAQPRGDPRSFHAIAVDERGPRYDAGIVTRVDSVPFSVMLNRTGRRFYDEGEDLWPKRYATWGRLIAEQPEQIAYSVFDSQVRDQFMPTAYPPMQADTLDELLHGIGTESTVAAETIRDYNAAVQNGRYEPDELDGCRTVGIDPPKSHWALRIEQPPFYAYPLRPGITFTYLGVAVDKSARVLSDRGGTLSNVFAAGEIMAGNILRRGYLAGVGMTIGAVFGQIAGEEAAAHARRSRS